MPDALTRALPSVAAVLLLAGAARAPRPAVSAPPARGTFTLVLGADTIAAERFTRSADRLEGDLTPRGQFAQQQPPFRYEATLRSDASVARIVATVSGAGGASAHTSSATFQGDSVLLVQGTDSVRRAAPPGAVPFINPSPSLMEQIVRRARALGGTRGGPAVSVPVFVAASGGQSATASVTFTADSARLALGSTDVLLRVDSAGAVLGGSVPAQGITIVRAAGAP